MTDRWVGSALPVDATKYSRGVVAVVAGSSRYPGAAVLAVAGARRGGAGYVRHISPSDEVRSLVVSHFPDVVPSADVDEELLERMSAAVVGPGTSAEDTWVPVMLRRILATHAAVVIDGGALDLVVNDPVVRELLNSRTAPTVITPHAGEAARLGATGDDRNEQARALAQDTCAVVVLKGSGTVVATGDSVVSVDTVAGPELATAGTGDVLAGLLGSMLAAHRPATAAACADVASQAVYVHACAGKAAAEQVWSVTALDVAAELGSVMRRFHS